VNKSTALTADEDCGVTQCPDQRSPPITIEGRARVADIVPVNLVDAHAQKALIIRTSLGGTEVGDEQREGWPLLVCARDAVGIIGTSEAEKG
jgi:hypothetical protein